MRWFARPDSESLQLRVAPELESWNSNVDAATVRLRAYLDDTEALLADSKVEGPWVLRLDVGRPPEKALLDKADVDNYAFPLAKRLLDSDLVSVWCTKQHGAESFVRVEAAREVPAPSTGVLVVETSGSWDGRAPQQQIHAALADVAELPPGPVRLELSFVVGPQRVWPKLWKKTIDALDPLLGRTYADKPWDPRDGRITELGLHVEVDPAVGHNVVIGIGASAGRPSFS